MSQLQNEGDEDMPFVICRTTIKITTITIGEVDFTFDEIPGARTEFNPTSLEELAEASLWLNGLSGRNFWPRGAKQNGDAIQGDLKSLWLSKLSELARMLAEKVDNM